MGIRHVGGIKQWGGYQRAQLIADLRDQHGLEAQEVAAKLGLSTREVNRRYRAYKALQQMRHDEDFADFAEPALYPLFHEAVEVSEVREWLEWSNDACKFNNKDNLQTFYGFLAPSPSEEGGLPREPKIKTYSDVRELRNILPNTEAKRFLMDPERPFFDALTIARKGEIARKWRSELAEATASLENIGLIEVSTFTDEDLTLLDKLIDAATKVRKFKDAYNQLGQS